MRYLSFLTFISLLLFSCEKKSEIKPVMPPVEVTDFIVEPKDIPAVFEFVGFAESSHPVEIRARVEGYLDKIFYDEGALVHQGDLLFQLDPRQFEAKVAQASAEVDRQAAIFENAKLTVDRLKPLYEQKAASKKDLDNAISSQLSSFASLQSAKAQLLDNEINLGYTTIKAPITGMANRARFHEGALISLGNNLLTNISVLDPIWVYFTVSGNDILKATQQKLNNRMTVPENDNYDVELIQSNGVIFPYRGKLNFNSPNYDQATGTLLVRAVFNNPDQGLRPGEFVRVKIYGAQHSQALYVPLRALMQKKNGMFVYLINSDNTVTEQDVSTAEWYEDYQIITNGLKTGDHIVVDGINKIRSGSKIKVIGPWKEAPQTTTPQVNTQDTIKQEK